MINPSPTEPHLSVLLPQEQVKKYKYLLPRLEEITRFLSVPLENNILERTRAFEKSPTLPQFYCDKLTKIFRDETQRFAGPLKQLEEKEAIALKEQFLKLLGEIVGKKAQMLFILKICCDNFSNGLGACQEISEIAAALLSTQKLEQLPQLSIETVAIASIANPRVNHQVVLINRQITSAVNNVINWGDDCLIFDPQLKKIYNIRKIPADAALRVFLCPSQTSYNITLKYCNRFDESLHFAPFLEGSTLLSAAAKAGIGALQLKISETVKEIIKPLDFGSSLTKVTVSTFSERAVPSASGTVFFKTHQPEEDIAKSTTTALGAGT